MIDDKQINSRLGDLLPELFDGKIRTLKPGGICSPESGCGPSTGAAETDIVKMLAGIAPPPLEEGSSDE